jgi:hypothetical protein
MLHSISWQSYWTCMVVLALLYYVLVYWLYFRNSTAPLHRMMRASTAQASPLHSTGTSNRAARDDNDSFSVPDEATEERAVYNCMDELNAFFAQAKKARWANAELVFALTKILKNYSFLTKSPYQASLTSVIRREAEHHCSVHLSDDEVAELWATAGE